MSHDLDRIKSLVEVVNWCKFHLGHESNGQMRLVHGFFLNTKLGYMNRSICWYCTTIEETRELHSVHNKDMGEIFSIKTRKYACFCDF